MQCIVFPLKATLLQQEPDALHHVPVERGIPSSSHWILDDSWVLNLLGVATVSGGTKLIVLLE